MNLKENNPPCIWQLMPKDNRLDPNEYEMSCDINNYHKFQTSADRLNNSGFKFCPYCGGHIVEVKDET
ncbi:hypothetical protein UFOVP459_72 [uncultured Caudovirales phage]|uniref:Uncharacterized protein n=1 Tax=uncultured Caudovirales phage TaxID=2100421 RepID=A0A6J5SG49_9CAUD|nr:hypothetical protein UFOVP459_72 [uncultured Caudovirales phage]CAB4182641.1 hypothetical protein UFOVP1089_13 [uncultured Caudovirales phage]CAB4212685.1 hypothetical protein UFOVP1443_32 [uncultured Caudovirales phage]